MNRSRCLPLLASASNLYLTSNDCGSLHFCFISQTIWAVQHIESMGCKFLHTDDCSYLYCCQHGAVVADHLASALQPSSLQAALQVSTTDGGVQGSHATNAWMCCLGSCAPSCFLGGLQHDCDAVTAGCKYIIYTTCLFCGYRRPGPGRMLLFWCTARVQGGVSRVQGLATFYDW